MAGPVNTVDEQNVLPAVAIIVEKSAPGAQSFGQELSAEGAAVVLKLNAGRRSDVSETKAWRT